MAISAVRVSLALVARISRTRLSPIFSTEPPALLAAPGVKGGEFGEQRGPVRLGQGSLVAEQRLDGGGLQRGNRAGPRRVDALRQRQRLVGSHLRQREAGNVGVRGGEIFGPQREEFLLVAVQRIEGARVESRQPAARKIVVHLGLDGFDGRRGGFGVQAQRQHRRVAFRLLPPVGIRGGIGEELVHLGLADARLAAGIGVPADASDDVVDDGLGRVVTGGIGGHDAVAVEGLGGKGLSGGGGLVNGDFSRFRLAQDLPGESGDQLAFGRGVVDGGQRAASGSL